MSNATMKAWGNIAYLKEVCDNHKRYNSFENALRADGYDTLPITVGIISSSVLSRYGLAAGGLVGIAGGIGINIYVNQKKETLDKNNKKTIENKSK